MTRTSRRSTGSSSAATKTPTTTAPDATGSASAAASDTKNGLLTPDGIRTALAAIEAEDPGARVLPYCLSAGTDNKPLSSLGILGYGFAPLQLPAGLDFAPLFHGIDERVPVDAVRFGARVLLRLVGDC